MSTLYYIEGDFLGRSQDFGVYVDENVNIVGVFLLPPGDDSLPIYIDKILTKEDHAWLNMGVQAIREEEEGELEVDEPDDEEELEDELDEDYEDDELNEDDNDEEYPNKQS